MNTKLTQPQLSAALDDLEARIPALISDCHECDLMEEIAGEVEHIEIRVQDEDRAFFTSKVHCMLRDAGLIPGDDEPCDLSDEPVRKDEAGDDLDEGTGGPVWI